ncbi:MAG: Lrp/AsnC family transcriptional regulator [Gammaproteobacteria bacterium]|uniref:Lrp/AsnC family transcriptional regulator n=1 Tax=Pseudomaricurvus alcaniphilus TaxID=1166482 RepID=UPI00140D2DB9|nr:Lrp/AsnC family transcriptional regulator [Pseudomaricurvus alcaniphilus]MBR9912943.1 Lrp/AsnC family transcriptional regulator [Gammaproteobacteria bacterium]NHN39486.1 Lrp/AsnC family transcriptional regulator [Pseudomaricurvus alcaniphilus]
MKLDRSERDILRLLQRDGRLSNVEIAQRVGLSESPCLRRIKALENAGVIDFYSAKLNQRLIGLQVTAFVLVSLEKQDERKRREFLQQVEAEEYIIECHAMSGSYDYLMKVVATSMDHFSDLCMNHILHFAGVTNIESQFSLQVVKENSVLPVNTQGPI